MNVMLLSTLGFAANYRVRRVNDPAPTGVRDFRQSDGVAFRDGITLQTNSKDIVIEVATSGGERWRGRFWGGAEGLDGVFATPHADVLCVVVRGQGYWVPVNLPTSFEVIRAIPVRHVLSVQDPELLIFGSYTRLSAYGARGFMWVTEDLSWDGLKDLNVTGGTVRGTAWDSPAGRDTAFSVDVVTGEAEGGSSPAKYGASR
jgi:hypothetical protein